MERTAYVRPSSLAVFFLLLASFFWAFSPVWSGLLQAWSNSEDYAHGFFIFPLAIFIVWRRRADLARLPRGTSWTGLVVVFLSLGLNLFGLFAGIRTAASLSLVLALAGAIAFLFGSRILRQCAFPLFLLLFMIPLPSQIHASLTAPLQLMVSKIAVEIIRLMDIPVIREGNLLHLSEHSFQVIQACSGLRSIISLLTLGLVIAFFTLRRMSLRILLFLSAIPIAVFVNIVRVVLMIIALHLFDLDLTAGALHDLFGVGIFLLALVLIFLLQKVFSRWEVSEIKPSC